MNMMPDYKTLANLLEYPHEKWSADVVIARESDSMPEFIDAIQKLSRSDLQELYTRTFDLNPACALEIGYHLFGESYKRGEFLANLRETEAPFDLGQANQLPDYLPVLLRLLTKLDDEDLRVSLIGECLIPALEKMLASLKDSVVPYRFLLEAVHTKLQSEIGVVPVGPTGSNTRASLPVLDQRPIHTPRELF